MESLGQKLRQQRQLQGKSLEDIAATTKINPSYLAAIEADEFDRLPAPFFVRSFVRQYAREVGLPESEYLPLLDRIVASLPQPLLPGQDDRPPRPASAWVHAGRPGEGGRPVAVWTVTLALVLLVFGGWLVHRYWPQGSSRADEMVSPPAVSPSSQPRPASSAPSTPTTAHGPAGNLPSSPVAALSPRSGDVSPSEVAPASTTSAPPPAPTPLGTGNLELTVEAREDTWLRIYAGEERLFVGLLLAGDRRVFRSNGEFTMLVGNAGGVHLSLNGHPLPPLGARGQVRRARLTERGVEFLSESQP